MLEAIYLESKSTVTHGGLVVDPRAPESPTVPDVALKVNSGGMRVNGGAQISGVLEVKDVLGPASALVCRGSAKVEGETETRSLRVEEAASVGGALTVTQGANVSGGLVVAAMANDAGASLTSGGDVKFAKALEVAGEETVKGYFTAKNGAGLAGPLVVSGTSRFDSMATLNGGLTASGPVRFAAADGGASQEVEFVSPVKFSGPVSISVGASLPIADGSVTRQKIKSEAPVWTVAQPTPPFQQESADTQLRWYRDPFGGVYVSGVLSASQSSSNGSAAKPKGTKLFELPQGARPGRNVLALVVGWHHASYVMPGYAEPYVIEKYLTIMVQVEPGGNAVLVDGMIDADYRIYVDIHYVAEN